MHSMSIDYTIRGSITASINEKRMESRMSVCSFVDVAVDPDEICSMGDPMNVDNEESTMGDEQFRIRLMSFEDWIECFRK